MHTIDSVRTDYALTFLVDTARDSDINPDQINKCHSLVADELTRLREENARLREALQDVLEGRPTTPPPEIMKGGKAWENWGLWQRCRKALGKLS